MPAVFAGHRRCRQGMGRGGGEGGGQGERVQLLTKSQTYMYTYMYIHMQLEMLQSPTSYTLHQIEGRSEVGVTMKGVMSLGNSHVMV